MTTLHRAFSLLTTKSVNDSRRRVTGIASTPTVDRAGDSVNPLGARFKTPMPLLLYHDSTRPVGTVDFAKPTKTGIPFEASLPKITEPGIVQDRVNEAWHSLKYKLLAACSIGFRALEDGVQLMKNGGLFFDQWEWVELSLCSIPSNPDALIQGLKAHDMAAVHRLLGTHPRDSAALIARLRSSSGAHRTAKPFDPVAHALMVRQVTKFPEMKELCMRLARQDAAARKTRHERLMCEAREDIVRSRLKRYFLPD